MSAEEMRRECRAFDWDRIRLVVFDLDGTLYRQCSLRARMAHDVLVHTISTRELTTIRVLRAYRRIRERLAEAEAADFEEDLIAETVRACGTTAEVVRAIVAEWIERRPLAYIGSLRHPGLPELFAGLRRMEKAIGVLSDYPVGGKLAALALDPQHVVSSADKAIGMLKPHPKGLKALMKAAGVEPDATVLIGDREERDGLAARRAGAWALIKSRRKIRGYRTFTRFDDALFAPFMRR